VNGPIRTVPEHRVIEMAVVGHGGTGRFQIEMVVPDETARRPVVVRSLSRGQAEDGARAINEALAAWADERGWK
jgi:hypothetical protein